MSCNDSINARCVRVIALWALLSLGHGMGVFAADGKKSLFLDDFSLSNATDLSADLSVRQKGGEVRSDYQVVTIPTGGVNDLFQITEQALSIFDSREERKGPAALALKYDFKKLETKYAVTWMVSPGKSSWCGVKWTPARNGQWPDLSPGVALIVYADGRWVVWNNAEKSKNIIGQGRVTRAGKYRIRLEFDDSSEKHLTVVINGESVINGKPYDYPWLSRNLVLEVLGSGNAENKTEPTKFEWISVTEGDQQ